MVRSIRLCMDSVRRLRKSKGWSQEELARYAGLDKNTVQRVELGRVVPTAQTIRALAEALDADPDALRQACGLTGLVTRMTAIALERPLTPREERRLPEDIAQTLQAYARARADCELALRNTPEVAAMVQDARDAFVAKSTSANAEKMMGTLTYLIAQQSASGEAMLKLTAAHGELVRLILRFR